jgi:hypothetical protein
MSLERDWIGKVISDNGGKMMSSLCRNSGSDDEVGSRVREVGVV